MIRLVLDQLTLCFEGPVRAELASEGGTAMFVQLDAVGIHLGLGSDAGKKNVEKLKKKLTF